MDSGFNMLGQFQGDSSLGLGSFQGNSYPSLEFSSLEDQSLSDPFAKISESDYQRFELKDIAYYQGWDDKTADEQAQIKANV